jgi:hypothetical protein
MGSHLLKEVLSRQRRHSDVLALAELIYYDFRVRQPDGLPQLKGQPEGAAEDDVDLVAALSQLHDFSVALGGYLRYLQL